jgi:hypothetical protein
VDPLTGNFAHNSPYAFSENRVIDRSELEGKEMSYLTDYSANRVNSKMDEYDVNQTVQNVVNYGLGVSKQGARIADVPRGIYDLGKGIVDNYKAAWSLLTGSGTVKNEGNQLAKSTFPVYGIGLHYYEQGERMLAGGEDGAQAGGEVTADVFTFFLSALKTKPKNVTKKSTSFSKRVQALPKALQRRPKWRKSTIEYLEKNSPKDANGNYIDVKTGKPITGEKHIGHQNESWREYQDNPAKQDKTTSY